MSAPGVGRLLISHITLRGLEIRQTYQAIDARPNSSYDDLVQRSIAPVTTEDTFGLQEATLREALDFLITAGLVEQQGSVRRKARFNAAPMLPDVTFPVLLLHHLQTLGDERQRAIALIYRQVIAQDILAITLPELRDDAERGPYGTLFAWTGEKMGFWGHLAAYLGLVRRLDHEAELLFVPRLDLVVAALQWAARSAHGTASLYSCLHTIDGTFFACFTASGRVHRGLAQTLIALHRLGTIHLTHHSDAAQSVLLSEWRVSDIYFPSEESTR